MKSPGVARAFRPAIAFVAYLTLALSALCPQLFLRAVLPSLGKRSRADRCCAGIMSLFSHVIFQSAAFHVDRVALRRLFADGAQLFLSFA